MARTSVWPDDPGDTPIEAARWHMAAALEALSEAERYQQTEVVHLPVFQNAPGAPLSHAQQTPSGQHHVVTVKRSDGRWIALAGVFLAVVVSALVVFAVLWSQDAKADHGRPVPLPDAWANIARCESGGNAQAVNPSSGAAGVFQFLPSTWHGFAREIGATVPADPRQATLSKQYRMAVRLQEAYGWSQWVCTPYGSGGPISISNDPPPKNPAKCSRRLQRPRWGLSKRQADVICHNTGTD